MKIDLDVNWKIGDREKHYRLSTTALVDKKTISENKD